MQSDQLLSEKKELKQTDALNVKRKINVGIILFKIENVISKINQTSKLEICMALFLETNPVKIMSLECIRFNLWNSVTCINFIKDDLIRSILYKNV
ncbi:hypothetical protein ABID42_003777 [Arcicella rosea]